MNPATGTDALFGVVQTALTIGCLIPLLLGLVALVLFLRTRATNSAASDGGGAGDDSAAARQRAHDLARVALLGSAFGTALLLVGQLVVGPLSDAYGRRRPLLAGAALHVVASLLVLVAPGIAALGALRVLQGVGTAAAGVVALAIVRDLFEGRAAATMLSRLFLVMGVAPVLAPTLDAYLHSNF